MDRLDTLFWTMFLLCIALVGGLNAQQEDFAEFVEKDAVAFLIIDEPATVMDEIESSDFFSHRCFERAFELLQDEEFKLMAQDEIDDATQQWLKLRETIDRVDQVSIVIHNWNGMVQPQWSVLLSATEETSAELENEISKIGETFASFSNNDDVAPDDDATSDDATSKDKNTGSKPDEPKAVEKASGKETDPQVIADDVSFVEELEYEFGKISVVRFPNLVLLSNAPLKSKELAERIEQIPNNKFRSLAKSRSFQRVQAVLDTNNKRPNVRGYINPENFPELFLTMIAPQLFDFDFEWSPAISAGGFQVAFERHDKIEAPDGSYQPVLAWDLVLLPRLPVGNLGKLIDAFEPLDELPVFPLDVLVLTAEQFDPQQRYKAYREIVKAPDSENQEPPELDEDGNPVQYAGEPFEALYGIYFPEDDFDVESVKFAANGTVSVVTDEPDDIESAGVGEFQLQFNHDAKAMETLLRVQLEEENYDLADSAKMKLVENEYGKLYSRTPEAFAESRWRFAPSPEEREQALAAGEDPRLKKALPYQMFLGEKWMVWASTPSMKNFLESEFESQAPPGAFELLLKNTKAKSNLKSCFKIEYQSHNFFDSRRFTTHEETRVQVKFPSFTKQFEVLMKKPDEFGLRNPLESKQDAIAAVKTLVTRAFYDTYGTSIKLFFNNDQRMHVFGQVFSYAN